MIPTNKPAYTLAAFYTALFHDSRAVKLFENELAQRFDFHDAVVFP